MFRWAETDFGQTDFGHPYFPTLAKSDFGQKNLTDFWPTLIDRLWPNRLLPILVDRLWPNRLWPILVDRLWPILVF